MSQFFTTYDEVKAWLDNAKVIDYVIQADLTVDVISTSPNNTCVELQKRNIDRLPVQFGIIQGSFDIDKNHLTTLEGCPHHVYGYFSCSYNPKLNSLKHHPRSIGSTFWCRNTAVASHLLSILMIDQLQQFSIGRYSTQCSDSATWSPEDRLLNYAEHIINKHLSTKDIFECQQELIDAGFPEYAQL